MSILQVKKKGKRIEISWPKGHPQGEQIEKWLKRMSPGYVEYLLKFGTDPHCSACRDDKCPSVGNGDDACPAFMYGEKW